MLILFKGQTVYPPPMYNPICYSGSTTCRALPGPVAPIPRPVSKVIRFR
jgi:hypothetical protein